MSFNDQINVLKDGGCVVCACCCSECTCAGGPLFALSAKACCFSVGIGFKAAAAAVAGAMVAGKCGAGKGGKAAAALAAAGMVDMIDDNAVDVNCNDACWDGDRGCCEAVCKIGCCYYELQCPPGQDIGIGCCGCRCCDNNDTDGPPPQEQEADNDATDGPPPQEQMPVMDADGPPPQEQMPDNDAADGPPTEDQM